MWMTRRDESDTGEGCFPPWDIRMIELTILDAVINLLGSKMFFMIQMKNVARGCYSF